MKAMLLAAGKGERLSPITKSVPKPLLPVLGRPLAPWVLTQLAADGVDEAVINLHHLPELMQESLGDGTGFGLRALHYSLETKELLGTGGGLVHAAPHLRGSDPLVVRNSDFLSDIDLDAVITAHVASGRPATLVLAPQRPGYTRVAVDGDGGVASFGDRGGGSHLFTGFHVLDPSLLDRLPVDRPSDIVRDLYVDLAREGELGAFVHDGFWWEFGTPQQYLEGSRRLIEMSVEDRLDLGDFDPVRMIGEVPASVGAGVVLHGDGIEIGGFVVVGLGVLVAEDARLVDTIVMPEAWIGPRSRLTRCIVGPGTEVPAGFTAEDAVLALDPDPAGPVPDGCERRQGILTRAFRTAANR